MRRLIDILIQRYLRWRYSSAAEEYIRPRYWVKRGWNGQFRMIFIGGWDEKINSRSPHQPH